MAIMALFLFSYSSLLFMVSYAFSDMGIKRLTLYCGIFIIVGLLAGIAGSLGVVPQDLRFYGTLAFAALSFCSFVVLLLVKKTAAIRPKWYVAALAPTLFLLLFGFYGQTKIGFAISSVISFNQFPYLLDVYGIIFAMLIVIYLNSLFTWKTVFIFAGFLTGMDIVLVWITQTMVQAAEHISGLGLTCACCFSNYPSNFDQRWNSNHAIGAG